MKRYVALGVVCYTCVTVGVFGQSGLPGITQNPTNLTVAPGQTAVFTVAATNGPFTYQWQSGPTGSGIFNNLFDGGQISGSSGPSLAINNVTLANAGDFRVLLQNGFGVSTSSVATLTVALSYTLNLSAGLSLIANQLDHGSNTLNEILPSVPAGSSVYKFDNATTNWSQANYDATHHSWFPPGITLNPGEGAFFQSPSNVSLTFNGTPHVPVLPVPIPSGACYLLSRQTNDVGNYLNIVGSPPVDGATIYQWNGSTYTVSSYLLGNWTSGGTDGPTAPVGHSMWIAPATSSGPVPIALPPAIVSTPQPALVVGFGSNATLSATASSASPVSYQWYKNTIPITSAINPNLTITSANFSDTGYYSLAVSNAFGITFSQSSLLRVSEIINTGGGGNQSPVSDFGDMPSTNWACWQSSYFDPTSGCSVKTVYSVSSSTPPVIYPTTLALNGARNSWTGMDMTWLGTDVSPTPDGVPNASAIGDPGVTNSGIGSFNSSVLYGNGYNLGAYNQEENGIRMIPCPFADPTINQNQQTNGYELAQSYIIDPRFTRQGLTNHNLFGSPAVYFVGGDPGYGAYGRHSQCYAPGQTLWFVVEAYNNDSAFNYTNGVSYLNVWVDYGDSTGPSGPPDGVFQPDEYVLVDQPLYGAQMLQDLPSWTPYPFDSGALGVADDLASDFDLNQPPPTIGIQPYASNGLQVVSLTLPVSLGDLTCGKNTFVRFRISKQPLNLWRKYNPTDGSAHVLDPVSGPAPTGPGYNTYGLLNSAGQPDPSLGNINDGGEVEDYHISFVSSCNVNLLTGPSTLCFVAISGTTSVRASFLTPNISTTLAAPISPSQLFIEVADGNGWPATPFDIQVADGSGNYELMTVTSAPSGLNVIWDVQRNTPQCTAAMSFIPGATVTLVGPCQCEVNNGYALPSGLLGIAGTDPGTPCFLPIQSHPMDPLWGYSGYPDQFSFLNTGSNILTGLNITYAVPTNAWLESIAASQGTWSNVVGNVTFSLGELDSGQNVIIGAKMLPFSNSGSNATFVHNFTVSADQPVSPTTFQQVNTVKINSQLSLLKSTSNKATLLWLTNDPTVVLQEKNSLLAPWTNAPVQSSPYTITATNPVGFFRLSH